MGIWAWVQPVDRIWKVVSDKEKGTICVFNEKSDMILEKKGFSKEAIMLIEENFLDVIGTRLTGEKPQKPEIIDQTPVILDNPMYI